MFDNVSQFLQIALLLMLLVLAVGSILLTLQTWQGKRVQTNERQHGILMYLIETGVWAAEQAYKSGIIPKEYREEYVIRFLQGEANKYHLSIDVEQIVVYIKAAVAQQLNQDKLVNQPHGPTPIFKGIHANPST
jgi:hypothetical protein